MSRRSLSTTLSLACAAVSIAALATPAAAAPSALDAAADPARLATAEQTLREQLGGAYANSWLDATTGKFVVAVTDANRAGEVRAAGAVAKVVRHSAATLSAVQSTLDARTASVPDSVTGWYVDAPTNQVVVSVLRGDPAGLAWANASGNKAVRVEAVTDAPRPLWNIIGGQAIYFGSGRCSVGFNARNASGTRYVITAGHCTNLGGTVSGTGGTIGPVAGSSFPTNDYGIIRVTSSAAVSTPLVDRYSSGSDVTVAGSTVTPVGGAVCRSGSTTGWRCGTVQAFNQTVNYGGGQIVGGLTRTSACAQPGDSGGSFVSAVVSGRVQAQGMTSGGSGNCTSGGTTFFQPVREAMSAYGLTLYTG
ncbi:Streptogrisin-C precursor (Serine protease C) (SGPC) [Alloactinosynnema sp. L-07]|uniref:S1 family peptidase n=1 Tax=Alloactinosynnema sp. L-07 TaxID=1653480 RepID=UPI00065EF474|nr:S1 family peptidase [Alloactinosynnema sp. L-07]CRK62089.1 Streptogrisin-C precursor (Serine protease C) (SGPC) [Alloactinosynnema sp. L-07]